MSQETSGNAGIREIATALGISIGTVDRALHGRSRVSAATRERVLQMARQLNYTPNLAARNLKLNRRFTIGVFLPREVASFFNLVRQGIQSAAIPNASGVAVEFHTYPRIGEGAWKALKKADWLRYDGIIIVPGGGDELAEFWTAAQKHTKPVVLVASDSPHPARLSSVTVDAYISGSIAAELLGRAIPLAAPVAIMIGDRRVQDHSEKLRGFDAGITNLAPHLNRLSAIETHDHEKKAYDAAKKLLRSHKDLGGLYISTANSVPVLNALEEAGRLGSVQLVVTDLFPELVSLLQRGRMIGTLEQRPFTQGRLAMEQMTRFLLTGQRPESQVRLAPHIVLRSNLPLFLPRIESAASSA